MNETLLAIWKITPAAGPEDPRWLGHRPASALYVAATSAAQARVLAAEQKVDPDQAKVGNESGHAHSLFLDEKLYHVAPADADEIGHLGAAPSAPGVLDSALLGR